MVQIHSPRPPPTSCLPLVYGTFSPSTAAAFVDHCGPTQSLIANSSREKGRARERTARTRRFGPMTTSSRPSAHLQRSLSYHLSLLESLAEKPGRFGPRHFPEASTTALFEERLANRLRIPGLEYNIPKPAGDSVAHFYSAGAVMIQMISLETPEVAIAGLSEM